MGVDEAGTLAALNSHREEFIDPITGENLGSEEEMIGMVKVVSVNEKYSKANASCTITPTGTTTS